MMQMWGIRQQVILSFKVQTLFGIMIVMALVIFLVNHRANAQTYYLGVLAPQGEVVAQQRWQPWLSELNKKLKEPNKKITKELQKLQEEHLPKLEKWHCVHCRPAIK